MQVNALGPVPVKGLTEPVEVFELVGASAVRRRLQAAAARGLTRFVGRDTEIEALQQALERAWRRAWPGGGVRRRGRRGQVAPGVRVVHSHRTQGWRVLESASVSYGKATPYFPVIDLLKRYAHVEDHDDPRTVRAKVTGQVLTLDEPLQDTIPALLALLDALPDDSPFLHLDPPQRRQRTLEALKRLLLRESQVQPLLLVFEDLHWIDAETQALLDSLVESLPTARLLLLVNYRPEYQHGWGSKTYYTQLRLDPLPPASADAFLQALLGDDPSLAPLTQLLIARTAGQSLLSGGERAHPGGDRGAGRRARGLSPGQDLPTIQVPATVQAVLAARIDRLPPEEKRLLQTAAVIGTEVPLAAAAGHCRAARGGAAPQSDAPAGGRVPLRDAPVPRAGIHLQARPHPRGGLQQSPPGAAAGAACPHCRGPGGARLPDRLAEQVERLAHHALRGEVWDKAVAYCRQAGTKALTALGVPRGGGVLRAGAGGPGTTCPSAPRSQSRPSISASTCVVRSCPLGEL